jgi:hypothetical protein
MDDLVLGGSGFSGFLGRYFFRSLFLAGVFLGNFEGNGWNVTAAERAVTKDTHLPFFGRCGRAAERSGGRAAAAERSGAAERQSSGSGQRRLRVSVSGVLGGTASSVLGVLASGCLGAAAEPVSRCPRVAASSRLVSSRLTFSRLRAAEQRSSGAASRCPPRLKLSSRPRVSVSRISVSRSGGGAGVSRSRVSVCSRPSVTRTTVSQASRATSHHPRSTRAPLFKKRPVTPRPARPDLLAFARCSGTCRPRARARGTAQYRSETES